MLAPPPPPNQVRVMGPRTSGQVSNREKSGGTYFVMANNEQNNVINITKNKGKRSKNVAF